MPDHKERGGLHARVLAELGPAIASGECPPGTVLRIDELERRYGVSRTVVREVVRVLEAMHLVASRRRVGITVRPAEEWNVAGVLVTPNHMSDLGGYRPGRWLRNLPHL